VLSRERYYDRADDAADGGACELIAGGILGVMQFVLYDGDGGDRPPETLAQSQRLGRQVRDNGGKGRHETLRQAADQLRASGQVRGEPGEASRPLDSSVGCHRQLRRVLYYAAMVDQSSRRVQIAQLRAHGYVVLRRFVAPADLQYPGAPSSRSSVGGGTVRRLLDAYARDPVFADSGTAPSVREWMQAYFEEPVLMSRAHHNCLMTKHPRYGSLTNWHRDSRYWAFEQENLVSVWIALGEESDANGGLWLVPGSHRMDFAAERFDQAKFFRSDLARNIELIETACAPTLEPGDALFFHSNTLHSANQNRTDRVKFSLVFTYHGRSNPAKTGTRSASKPEVPL
jgi:phytanoyl-CoA hydroxylase